jgi:hypothetical protein
MTLPTAHIESMTHRDLILHGIAHEQDDMIDSDFRKEAKCRHQDQNQEN